MNTKLRNIGLIALGAVAGVLISLNFQAIADLKRSAVPYEEIRAFTDVFNTIKTAIGSNATFTWVPADFLSANGVRGWRHMPIWLPPTGPTGGFLRRSNAKAVAAGLTFRPLSLTAKDTLAWHKTRPEEEQKAMLEGAIAGISPAREAEVLTAWKAKAKG